MVPLLWLGAAEKGPLWWPPQLLSGHLRCWIGQGGFDCDFRSGAADSINVEAAQRVQHGKAPGHVTSSLGESSPDVT